jgi:hypothetical protein
LKLSHTPGISAPFNSQNASHQKLITISERQIGLTLLYERKVAPLGKENLPLRLCIQLYSLPMRAHDQIGSRGRLKHTSIPIRPPIDGISQAYALGGRLLLLFTAILIFVMPWTEYFCQFDRFLRGGQDLELGLLSLLSIFSLVLVLLQQRRQNVALLLTVRKWLSLVFGDADPRLMANACRLIAHSDAAPLSSSPLCRYNLPIQI